MFRRPPRCRRAAGSRSPGRPSIVRGRRAIPGRSQLLLSFKSRYFLNLRQFFMVGFLTWRQERVNVNLKLLDSQTPDFIEDVNGFQLPAEEMTNEMGQETPTLFCGLFRQKRPAQAVALHLPPH